MSLPLEILVRAVRPGISADSHPLQISLEVSESGRSPWRLPMRRMSRAAASASRGSTES